MSERLLTARQATLWVVLHQLGSALLFLPSILATVAKQDAWISILFAIGIQLMIFPIYRSIFRKLNGNSFEHYIVALFGNFLGKIILFGFIVCYPFLIMILVIRDLGDFTTTSVVSETPPNAIYLIALSAVVYAVRCGTVVIGRTAEILFFLVLFLFLFGYVSLIPNVSMDRLLPVFENGWKPSFHASLTLLAFPYVESVLYLFFAANLKHPEKWKKAVLASFLFSGCLFFVLTFISIGVLGPGVISHSTYPSYFVVRTISFAGFYERFEVVIGVLWFVTIFFRMALLLHVSSQGLSVVFGLRNPKPLLIPLALISLTMASVVWPNSVYFITSLRYWTYYSYAFGILFPVLIWLAGKMKR